jgi:hypothetical protein
LEILHSRVFHIGLRREGEEVEGAEEVVYKMKRTEGGKREKYCYFSEGMRDFGFRI